MLMLLFTSIANAQDADSVYSDSATTETFDSLLCDDQIFTPSIRTVLLHPEGQPGRPPLLRKNSPGQLLLSFDELDGEERSLRYTLVHCDASWHISLLQPQDFLAGNAEGIITVVYPSFNTTQRYIHYTARIPGELQPQLSGNYLLKVYDHHPDSILLTVRMMLSEDKVTVMGRVHQATEVEQKKYRQEADFSISTDGYPVSDPFNGLEVCVYQNRRKDNALCGLKPRYVKNELLDYDYDDVNVFEGGHEFRMFDARSCRTPGQRIARIRKEADGCHLFVEEDHKRSYLRYTYDQDMNGGFRVATTDGTNDSLEADYVWVHFELEPGDPVAEGEIFVAGEFNQWNFSPANRMEWDPASRTYKSRMLLKQGVYDYCYLFRSAGWVKGETSVVEGDHYETENEYLICVYSREPGARYDRLVAAYSLSILPGK